MATFDFTRTITIHAAPGRVRECVADPQRWEEWQGREEPGLEDWKVTSTRSDDGSSEHLAFENKTDRWSVDLVWADGATQVTWRAGIKLHGLARLAFPIVGKLSPNIAHSADGEMDAMLLSLKNLVEHGSTEG